MPTWSDGWRSPPSRFRWPSASSGTGGGRSRSPCRWCGALGTRELFDLARKQGIDAARRFGIATASLCGPLALLASPRGPLAGVSSIDTFLGWWPYLGALWILALLIWALARRAPGNRRSPPSR